MAEGQKRGWLERPEGKFGTVVTIALAAAVGVTAIYFWGVLLPWIITMLTNTLTALALAAVIAVIGVVVFDKRWRNLIWYGYKSLMRALTGMFIEIDPIGILKTYVKSLEIKLGEMDGSIANLKGHIKKLEKDISDNEANRQHSLQVMAQAKDAGPDYRNTMVLQSRQAGRLQKSNMTLQNMLDRMKTTLRVLEKMRGAAAIMVEDIRGEVDVKTKERAALLASYGAFTAARKIMQGGGDEKEIFDMTMEKLTDDYGMKMGEIESFMDVSKGFIDTVDLDNKIFEADALEQLEQWEKKSQNLLVSNPPPGINGNGGGIRVEMPPAPAIRVGTEEEEASPDSFSDLFKKNKNV